MLTIGELARLSGTTVRAVRHYHAAGVLPEPPRDASGYRRYGAFELVRLVRIRQLRDLGVPLARIRAVLDTTESFDAALDALDAELAARAAEIEAQRARIAQVRARAAERELPAPLGELFAELAARFAAAGGGGEYLDQERDVLLLVLALAPEGMEELVETYRRMLTDSDLQARLAELDRRFAALATEPAESSAVEALVDAVFADPVFAAELAATEPDQVADARTMALLQEHFAGSYQPAQRRFLELLISRVREHLRARARAA